MFISVHSYLDDDGPREILSFLFQYNVSCLYKCVLTVISNYKRMA